MSKFLLWLWLILLVLETVRGILRISGGDYPRTETTTRKQEAWYLTVGIIILLLVSHAVFAEGTEVPPNKDAPAVEGRPLTSVVVTQCSLIVAVYVTMPDGRLVRFDRENSKLPADKLLAMAYTAERSERMEISCDGTAIEGFERHGHD